MQFDEFHEQNTAFLEWLRNRGVDISPKIGIHDYRQAKQGRGIIALDDIQEDEAIFTIPRGSVLSVDADTRQEFAAKVPEILELDTWMSLILYMIYHTGRKDSEFAPYIAVLPQKFSTLMYWDQKEVSELLTGSTIVNKIGKEEAEESFRTNLVPIFEAHRDVFDGIDVSVDAFHRMGSLIMSYSFDVNRYTPDKDTSMSNDQEEDDDEANHMSLDMSTNEEPHPQESDSEDDGIHTSFEVEETIEDDENDDEDFPVKAMVPLADTLNAHSKLCNAHLCQEDDLLVMRATSNIPKGTQVYNTYGDFPNGDLLRRYGYVEAGGTDSDIVEITIANIVSAVDEATSSSKFSTKEGYVMELVDQLAVWEDDILEIVDDSYDIQMNGTPSSDILVLISFLTFAIFRSKEYKAMKRSLKAPSATPENNRKTLKRMIGSLAKYAGKGVLFGESRSIWQTLCSQRLAQYPTKFQTEPENSLAEASVDKVVLSHSGMAHEVLAGEIRILKNCLEWVNQAPIVGVEDLEIIPKDSAGSKRKFGYGAEVQDKKQKRSSRK